MPSVSAFATGQTTGSWTISDLSSAWTSANYDYAYVVASGSSGSHTSPAVFPPTSNTGTSVSGVLNGLSPGTFYTVEAYAVAANGTAYPAGTTSFTTQSPPAPSISPPSISYRDQNVINLTWSPVSNGTATSYTLQYRVSGSSFWSSQGYGGSTFSGSISGVGYGIQYEFRMQANVSGYGTVESVLTIGTSQPKRPSLSGEVTNGVNFNVYVGNMEGNWSSVTIERRSSTDVFIDSKTVNFGSNFAQWAGIPANTTHIFRAYSNYVGLTSTFSANLVLQNNRPQNFAWTTAKTQGQPFNLTASEWNALTARINLFRVYRGMSNYSFTTVSSGQPFQSFIFNQAVAAISAITSPTPPTTSPPSTKSPGNPITAADLNRLRDSINSVA